MTKTISVVIPALNEEEGITETIRLVPKSTLEHMGYEVEIVVVDNDSTDRTADLARRAGANVIHELKRGYGYAFKAGFAHAKGDIIITADADATYPLEDIPRLVNILADEQLDFLTSNRFALLDQASMSRRNRAGNAVLTMAMRLLFGLPMQDSQSGMWVFSRALLGEMVLRSNGMALSQEIKIEACYFCKSRWKEVPIRYKSRLGKVKLRGWRDGLTNLLALIKKRLRR